MYFRVDSIEEDRGIERDIAGAFRCSVDMFNPERRVQVVIHIDSGDNLLSCMKLLRKALDSEGIPSDIPKEL